MLLAFLLACRADKPAAAAAADEPGASVAVDADGGDDTGAPPDTDGADDTGVAVDTADRDTSDTSGETAPPGTGAPPDTGPFLGFDRGSCEVLIGGRGFSTANEVAGAHGWLGRLVQLLDDEMGPPTSGSCPAFTWGDGPMGGGATWYGGCRDTAGCSYDGSIDLRYTRVSVYRMGSYTVDGWSVRCVAADGSVRAFAADGTSSYYHDYLEGIFTASWDLDWRFRGTDLPDAEGVLVYRLSRWEYGYMADTGDWTPPAEEGEAYVRLVSRPATGDWCEAWATFEDTGCVAEGDGTATFTAATDATLTWEGADACDGCGTVSLGGVDAGTGCDSG